MLRNSQTPAVTLLVVLLALAVPKCRSQEREPQWRDLIAAADLDKGVVAGEWSKSRAGLRTNAATSSRVRLARIDAAEYDFRIEFTRASGEHSIAMMFPHGNGQATFEVDAWGEDLAGLQMIRERDMRENGTSRPGQGLANGRRYAMLVEVRKGRVRCFLNKQLLVEHRSDGSDLSMLPLWSIEAPKSLGVGAYEAETLFHSIEYRVVGTSASTRPTPHPAATTSTPRPPRPNANALPAAALERLSDEFNSSGTKAQWLRVFQVEQSPANQLERYDISRYREGWMTMTPYTTSWYEDYRGPLVHKRIPGHFVATTRVRTTSRAGQGAPRTAFSLAGIMIRTPRDVTPQTWQPGQENYIFLSHGAARNAGRYQFEVKATRNSRSQLEVTAAAGSTAEIRVARLDAAFILLRRNEGESEWTVHQRYRRPDMPAELQVGMTVYTDYSTVRRTPPAVHNRTVLRNGRPDLIASFDYFRFARPVLPPPLSGRDLTDPAQVSDAQLLSFLGRTIDPR